MESGIEAKSRKPAAGESKLRRIVRVRERVNLHSIKFVVIKSISTIQPAWPSWSFTLRTLRALYRNHLRVRLYTYMHRHKHKSLFVLPIGILINHARITSESARSSNFARRTEYFLSIPFQAFLTYPTVPQKI